MAGAGLTSTGFSRASSSLRRCSSSASFSRVINAMARRSANFIGRLSAGGPLLFNGGLSHCAAFARMLESHVAMPVYTHPDAQFAGAIGAALIGQRQRKRG